MNQLSAAAANHYDSVGTTKSYIRDRFKAKEKPTLEGMQVRKKNYLFLFFPYLCQSLRAGSPRV